MNRTRRAFLRAAASACAIGLAPRAFAQAAPLLAGGRLVVVFLRGAYDGLSAFVPYADPDYARLRQATRIPPPDGGEGTAIRLDERFAMHPALAPMLPMWRDGILAVVPAAGSPHPTRSHFEAQHHWETGMPGKSSEAPGWMNRLASLEPPGVREQRLVGVGEANPRILAGDLRARLVPRGPRAARQGVVGNERVRHALADLYAADGRLADAFRAGTDSRMATARDLATEMMQADNGAGPAAGLVQSSRQLATLMRAGRELRLGFLSAGGWDTHANQGGVQGQLANQLGGLARALVELRAGLSQPGDLILVMSEFGRTAAENGTRGTDHGRGNALWLIGERVAGGRMHGRWEGLAHGNLNEGRDLPVLHDFRAIVAQALARNFGLSESRLAELFPGATWDAGLDGLLKRA
jgi:uncharacterized protein (DUF1501 family)